MISAQLISSPLAHMDCTKKKWCSMKSKISSFPFNLNSSAKMSMNSLFKLVLKRVFKFFLFFERGVWNQVLYISSLFKVFFLLNTDAKDSKSISWYSSFTGTPNADYIKALLIERRIDWSGSKIFFISRLYLLIHSPTSFGACTTMENLAPSTNPLSSNFCVIRWMGWGLSLLWRSPKS